MALLVSACGEKEETRPIEILRVAVLPDHDKEEIQRTHQELLKHIGSRTDLKTQLIIPDSYEELLRLFDEKAIDLALFGGVTYVKAHLKNGAVPLVMRDVDGHFRSVALVHAGNPADDIADLRGASLAFGSKLSTSGHIMPRYFLEEMNIIPEKFFGTIQYTGAHDLTAQWVRDGIAEVGIANSGIVNGMFLSGKLNNNMVKIIWQSPPFSDNVWALQPDISKRLTIEIRDSFLCLNHKDSDKALMKKLGANYYIPVTHDNFKDLEQVIRHMEQQKDTP
ncbi:MAG: phosphate/phosphite/phosphonate ABC transporter substrate-binding protein [Emcibacter sp.]|nr:phosphate/phosphite/phosphonate ABC transporter substrate-binding protein [Emcibacter sp.]